MPIKAPDSDRDCANSWFGRISSGTIHVQAAKQSGASREEVISAVLIGLPAAGRYRRL